MDLVALQRLHEGFRYTYDFGDDWRHTIAIEAIADADPKHEQHRELKRWHGRPFDPAHAAEDEIQTRMKKLARRRALGKAGFEQSRSQAR